MGQAYAFRRPYEPGSGASPLEAGFHVSGIKGPGVQLVRTGSHATTHGSVMPCVPHMHVIPAFHLRMDCDNNRPVTTPTFPGIVSSYCSTLKQAEVAACGKPTRLWLGTWHTPIVHLLVRFRQRCQYKLPVHACGRYSQGFNPVA